MAIHGYPSIFPRKTPTPSGGFLEMLSSEVPGRGGEVPRDRETPSVSHVAFNRGARDFQRKQRMLGRIVFFLLIDLIDSSV